jgi:hypothetical protein
MNQLFENPNQIMFDENDMSNVSFMNTNIAKVKFSLVLYKIRKINKIIEEEEWSEENDVEKKDRITIINLLSIYRNLRNNLFMLCL